MDSHGLPSLGRANGAGILRESPPVPPPREDPPPKHASSSRPGSPAKKKKGKGVAVPPPFNRLQLAAALIEYDGVSGGPDDGTGSPSASASDVPLGKAGYWSGQVSLPEAPVLKRAQDSAIFTPFRGEAPKQIDFFSDLDVPASDEASRRRIESETSMDSSGFGLATVTGMTMTSGDKSAGSVMVSNSSGVGTMSAPGGEKEVEEQETLAEWGLDDLLNKLGSAKDRPRPGPPSRTHSTFTDARPRVTSDTSPYGPPPASPLSDTLSLPDVLDRSIFRPPSAADHPLLKGHAVLARPALTSLHANELDERRRAQSFDVIRRPTPPSPPFPPSKTTTTENQNLDVGDPYVRQRRVTMLDSPHEGISDDLLAVPTRPIARPRPGRVPRMSSDGPSRSSYDIAERYRASVAMLTEPFDALSERSSGGGDQPRSGDFTVPMPAEYTSRFDPKVARMMQEQKDRDAELNASPRKGVPEVLVEGQDPSFSEDRGRPLEAVFDDQQRMRFPNSLNPKVLVMPAPLTPPDFEMPEEEQEEEEQEEEKEKVERPAGKLYGRSLIDELTDRKAAQKSRQKAFAGDNRPKMFANSHSTSNLSLIATGGDRNSIAFPTSASTDSLSTQVQHARSMYASAALASSRAHASVFGIDKIMERELEKVRVIEAREAEVREEERRKQEREEEEARRKAESKRGKKKTLAMGAQSEEVQKVASRLEEQWQDSLEASRHEQQEVEPVETLQVPLVNARAPSLDLPTIVAEADPHRTHGDMHDWFSETLKDGDGESSSEDGFSDANSIARHLDRRQGQGARLGRLPRVQQTMLGSTASVHRVMSISSEAGLLGGRAGREPGTVPDVDGEESDDEPLVALAQRRRAASSMMSRPPAASAGMLELPTLDLGSRRFTELDADGRSIRSVRTGGSKDSEGDDVPLGFRASVSAATMLGAPFVAPPVPVWRTPDEAEDDVPLARLSSSMSFGAGGIQVPSVPTVWPPASTPVPTTEGGKYDGLGHGRPPTSPGKGSIGGRRPSVPLALDSVQSPSFGIAVNDDSAPPTPPTAAPAPQTPSQKKGLAVPESPMDRPFRALHKGVGSVPVSPAISSNASSPGVAGRTVARQDTLAALEGGGVKADDEDKDDEVPLGYARAALRADAKKAPVTIPDGDSSDEDDRPLGALNPMAVATKQLQDAQTMMLLMQQQDAAFNVAAAPTMLGMPYGMPYGGSAFPPAPGSVMLPPGSASFLSHDVPSPHLAGGHPMGVVSPAEALKRESISRWRVGVQPDA